MYYLFCWCFGSSESCINPKGINFCQSQRRKRKRLVAYSAKKPKYFLQTILEHGKFFFTLLSGIWCFRISNRCQKFLIHVFPFPFTRSGACAIYTLWFTCSLNHPLTTHTIWVHSHAWITFRIFLRNMLKRNINS